MLNENSKYRDFVIKNNQNKKIYYDIYKNPIEKFKLLKTNQDIKRDFVILLAILLREMHEYALRLRREFELDYDFSDPIRNSDLEECYGSMMEYLFIINSNFDFIFDNKELHHLLWILDPLIKCNTYCKSLPAPKPEDFLSPTAYSNNQDLRTTALVKYFTRTFYEAFDEVLDETMELGAKRDATDFKTKIMADIDYICDKLNITKEQFHSIKADDDYPYYMLNNILFLQDLWRHMATK